MVGIFRLGGFQDPVWRCALQVLKYLVMASILHESKIDPFDSQEAKPYKQDPEIVAMTNLVAAFRNKQIKVCVQGTDSKEGLC